MMKKSLTSIWVSFSTLITSVLYGQSYLFESEAEARAAFPEGTIIEAEILDLSYDQVFKTALPTYQKLSETEAKTEAKTKALVSFLNSIYFPGLVGDEAMMIREIVPLDKEMPNIDGIRNKKVMFCDVACKCICYSLADEERHSWSFNLEVQRSAQQEFMQRLLEYAQGLRKRSELPVKGLGLLNYPQVISFIDKSECLALCRIDPKTNVPERLDFRDDLLEVNTIDLRKFAEIEGLRKKGQEAEAEHMENNMWVNGKKLDIVGVTWLKLFALRQWCKIGSIKGVSYKIYYPDSIDENIKSVIENVLVAKNTEIIEELKRVRAMEIDAFNMAKDEGRAEGMAAGIAEGRAAGIAEGRAAGIAEGRAAGIAEGKAAGAEETQREMVKNMLEFGMSLDEVVRATKLLREDVDKIADELSEEMDSEAAGESFSTTVKGKKKVEGKKRPVVQPRNSRSKNRRVK